MRLVVGKSMLRVIKSAISIASAALASLALISCAATAATDGCESGWDYVKTSAADMDESACSQLRQDAIALFCRGRPNNVASSYDTLFERDFETCTQDVAVAIPQFCRKAVQRSSTASLVCVKIPGSAKPLRDDDTVRGAPDHRIKTNEDNETGRSRSKSGDDSRAIEGACRITRTC